MRHIIFLDFTQNLFKSLNLFKSKEIYEKCLNEGSVIFLEFGTSGTPRCRGMASSLSWLILVQVFLISKNRGSRWSFPIILSKALCKVFPVGTSTSRRDHSFSLDLRLPSRNTLLTNPPVVPSARPSRRIDCHCRS